MKYIVHQRHHYGWAKTAHEAENPEQALLKDIYAAHPWLKEYGHTVEVKESEQPYYSVKFNGEPFPPCFYYFRHTDGGHWFGGLIHIGEPDDCPECGGTGANFYTSNRQCWACGDETIEGQSSGKLTEGK